MTENSINNKSKIEELEAKNTALENEVVLLATRNSQLVTESISSDDEIDLRELWHAIWQGKWLIMGITAIFSIAAVLYALWLPNEYKSTTILAPASSSSASSLSKLAGQFGGLASLAGINLGGGGGDDKTDIAMELIKTWGFQEEFIKNNHLEVEVFAAKGWNRTTNKLIIDSDIYDEKNKKWVREFNPAKGETAEPNSWQLFKKFKDMISINQDKKSSLVNLSVTYYSPIIAKKWADKLVKAINDHMQSQDKKEAIKSINYLKQKIKETNIADMQSVFYQLIEEQTKTLMLTEVSDEYIFKTLSPAKVAEVKDKPKRAMIAVLGFLLGGMLSVIVVLIRHFRNQKPITHNS